MTLALPALPRIIGGWKKGAETRREELTSAAKSEHKTSQQEKPIYINRLKNSQNKFYSLKRGLIFFVLKVSLIIPGEGYSLVDC